MWTVQAKSRNIHVVDVNMSGAAAESLWLLTSDRHHDNPKGDHELERQHLEEAKRLGAGIIDCGDLFCAMEGRADPRRSRQGVRPEHAVVPDYFDSLVSHAHDFYAPYARNFVVLGRGNHETSVLKNQETDLTERLCERMTHSTKHKVHSGGYGGWVVFNCRWHTRKYTYLLKYFHGSGGGGLMTMDTLRIRRIAGWTPDANVIVGGHTHDQWWHTIGRERLHTDTGAYQVRLDVQHHVRCGTYKDEYGDGYGGWHVERGGPPKPLGAVWMRLYYENLDRHNRYRLAADFRRAV
jgi:hypothetical protein